MFAEAVHAGQIIGDDGRISGLLDFLLVYFSFLWNKELHVVAGDLSGT